MPVSTAAMRVTGPLKLETIQYDDFHSCKKPPMLSYAFQKHIIGRSCPDLRTSCIAPDYKEDILHVKSNGNEKEPFENEKVSKKNQKSVKQHSNGTDFCRPLRIPGREVTFLGVQFNRKSSEELVMTVNGLLNTLEFYGRLSEGDSIRLSKTLLKIKAIVCSPKVTDPRDLVRVSGSSSGKNCQTMLLKLIEHECIANLVSNVAHVGFEDRKIISLIFCNAMRRDWVIKGRLVKYLEENSYLMTTMLEGYRIQALAFTNGKMLRECFRVMSLGKLMLESEDFYKFFDLMQLVAFEISSDAFISFTKLLTEHRLMSANFLEKNYEKFFSSFKTLMDSDNYVTKLSSLRFLSSMLLDKYFFNIMTSYVQEISYLKTIMVIMAEGSPVVSFAAYQTFKIFAVNPDASLRIAKTLQRNKSRIFSIIEKLSPPSDSEEKFLEENSYLKNYLNVDVPKIITQRIEKK